MKLRNFGITEREVPLRAAESWDNRGFSSVTKEHEILKVL
jgi:hypothetical protein